MTIQAASRALARSIRLFASLFTVYNINTSGEHNQI